MNEFLIALGQAYFNQGFINIPVAYQEHFGEHGSLLNVYLGQWGNNMVEAQINRTANINHTPRIMMGVLYTEWVQQHHVQNEMLAVTINNPLHPNSILLQ